MTERELIARTADYLHERGFEHRADAEDAAREFVEFCRGRAWILSDAGTTARGEVLYRFTHRTFLEYFAACHLASVCDTPQQLARKLAPHVARAEWDVVAQLAVQIKDRVQDRGAERFFGTLIEEKRRRSTEGRANVLQFLARCLSFAEPPPQVVRGLVRAVLDHFTAGDPDDVDRYRPLAALIKNAGSWRDVVAEDIAAAADRGVAQHKTLLWLANIDDLLPARRERKDAFWTDWYNGLIHRYGDAIVEAARSDDRLWLAAVLRPLDAPLLSARAALALREEASLVLLEDRPTGAFSTHWGSLADFLLSDIIDRDEDHAMSLWQIAELGSWFTGMEPPFFQTRWPDTISFWTRPGSVPADMPDLTGDAYLGAALLIAGTCEANPEYEFHVGGGMADLDPYLNGDPEALPDLPMPSRFQTWFRQWAANEVTFVEHLPEPPAR